MQTGMGVPTIEFSQTAQCHDLEYLGGPHTHGVGVGMAGHGDGWGGSVPAL